MVMETFDLRPAYLIDHFDMRKPIYKQLAAYGHFGRVEWELAWEKKDMVEAIRAYFAAGKG